MKRTAVSAVINGARAVVGVVLTGLAVVGCDGPTEPPPVSVVVTSPIDTIVVRGRSVQLAAAAFDDGGSQLVGVSSGHPLELS